MRSLPCLSLGLLFACHAQPSNEGSICRTESGLRGGWDANGKNLNGIQVQGSNLNGVWQNGIWENGVWSNGSNLNGQNLNGIQLQGSTLVGIATDGQVHPLDMTGATITAITAAGERIDLTFTAMEQEGDLTYYALSFADGTNVCGDEGKGLFIEGTWDESGRRHDALGSGDTYRDVTYSCTTGVIAKCARWGYEPWIVGADLHQTCTRMARADYCGDGIPHTQNGTLIDVYDAEGIQIPAAQELPFEAGWGPNGAVCVHHARYQDQVPSCWNEKPSCESFDEALDQGALIGNSSRTSALCAE